ncbi:hypothetical protein ACQEWB_33825 [Streptomyces sp. CA-249302]|uniref:hypothetical protein n=1 Tax=Streptomyces sp. CA-249302 TaxID=3240058 RepID=UPI003D8B41EB
MPADEVTHGTDVDESRVRTGPRHAAPKKPLFTRFHMPAGKAIATVAMPTAVLMGMGFTSSLALADSGGSSSSKSLTADEYKDCVTALADSSASPSASASSSSSADEATPSPSASADTSKDSSDSSSDSDTSSSSDSGSDEATPSPSASASKSSDSTATSTPSASASSTSGGLLDDIGNTISDILTGGSSSSTSSASATPSASASPSASATEDSSDSSVSDTVKDTTKKVTDTVEDTTDTATKAADSATKAVEEAADAATSSASPSASSSTDAEDCPAATDDESGVDNKVAVADDPWYLSASSLTLKSADYQGVVEVKTANGTKKKVLKYVISGGTDIGDLHQTVKDTDVDKTYHVQAASGSTSTITDGATTMYTESISGNLFGLIPITFSPDNPPPLNIPLIYFTNVKVVQAAQFGGTLHVPGMHVYTTDGTG